MNELFLFFENESVASIDDLERLGFGAYVDRNADGIDISWTFFDDAVGPRGETGSLAVLSASGAVPPSKPVTIDLSNQYWERSGDEPGDALVPVWIGYRPNFAPDPHSLRRRRLFHGTKAPLASEQWQLPILLRLPLEGYGTEGKFEEVTEADRLAQRFAGELIVAGATLGLLANADQCPVGCRSLVEHALGRNYRGDWRLWKALGLFDGLPGYTLMAALHAIGVKAISDAQEGGLV